ncbi:hypothetical protein [uncultured Chryseobacterium sp.]|uniref:hypothetical protein n=1 Tax=uncultured Chryseobacterium sp. TaxID=259322 RepID=UPI0025CDAD6A|nr:hypothetical protein [uncultured Chryseobacterium sp.]
MAKYYTFKPFIPKDFGSSHLGRLFIVGDSHYIMHDVKDIPNFTIDIINELGLYKPARFFTQIGKLFNSENYKEVYTKVAFANAIQIGMNKPNQSPTYEHFQTVEPAIRLYLDEIKPNRMVVFSKRAWEKGLPNNITWGNYVETLKDEKSNLSATVWKFNYEEGSCYGIGLHHPSYKKFNPTNIKSLLNLFLAKDYENII